MVPCDDIAAQGQMERLLMPSFFFNLFQKSQTFPSSCHRLFLQDNEAHKNDKNTKYKINPPFGHASLSRSPPQNTSIRDAIVISSPE
jgi:hypothetical protein